MQSKSKVNMKKAVSKLAAYIPHSKKSDQLQLVNNMSKVVSLAENGVELLKEKEKTAQVLAQVRFGIEKVEADKVQSLLDYETQKCERIVIDKQNQRIHKEKMSELNDSHEQRMEILRQVDAGKIPSEQLVDLISQTKTRG